MHAYMHECVYVFYVYVYVWGESVCIRLYLCVNVSIYWSLRESYLLELA